MDHIYAVGVGGANIDLCGRSYAPIEPRDSNPGEIEISSFPIMGLDVVAALGSLV